MFAASEADTENVRMVSDQAVGNLMTEKPDENQGSAGNNSQPPANGQGQPPAHGAIHEAGTTPEEKHRADEKKHWRVQNYTGILSALLTAGALGGALASAIISNQALRVSQVGTRAALLAASQATRQADYAEEQLKLSKSNQLSNDIPNIQISFEPIAQDEMSAGEKRCNAGPSKKWRTGYCAACRKL